MVPARYDVCRVHFIHTEATQNTEEQEDLGSVCEDRTWGKL
jgi:hypothetical protein